MYLLRMPRWARMEAGQIKGHQFSIVASRINISRTVPSSLYVTQRIPSMIAKNQVFSTNFFMSPSAQRWYSGPELLPTQIIPASTTTPARN